MKYIEKTAMWLSCAAVSCFGMYIMKRIGCATIMLVPLMVTILDNLNDLLS